VDHADLASALETLHPDCFGWAMTCCGRRREEAEDVLHDAYVTVLDGPARFDGRSSLRTWLFGIIRQTARGRRRRDRVRALLGLRHAARIRPPASAPMPDEDAVAGERRERTLLALGRLPTRQRELLLLVFYHDLTIEEASRVLGISVGSARVHYQRGKKRMAMLLPGERP